MIRARQRPVLITIVSLVASFLAYFSQPAMAATVATYSWLPSPTALPPSAPDCATQFCSLLDYQGPSGPTNSPLPTIPVNYLEDALTLTTVSVTNTQITITNNFAGLFCPSSGCTGFSGFQFIFSGLDIAVATVDPSSSPDFLPNSTAPHLGLDLVSATELWVDLSEDDPVVGSKLIIDLSPTVTATPLPAALPLFATGLGGLGLLGWRRKRKSGA